MKPLWKILLSWAVVGILSTLLIESLQSGMSGAISLLVDHFYAFLFNVIIFLVLTSPVFFVKRRVMVYLFTWTVLVTCGCINAFLVAIRGVPLLFMDLLSIFAGIGVLGKYISVLNLILIGLLLVVVLTLLVYLWKREAGKSPIEGKRILFTLLFLTCVITMNTFKTEAEGFLPQNLKSTYIKEGFLYSFVQTANLSKRVIPDGYSIKKIQEIKEESTVKGLHRYWSEEAPNLLFIQLESFFDPTQIPNVTFSSDPIPNFRNLEKNYMSGKLQVPTFGGDTPRTEFEVLTGLNIETLAPGEIPHNTFLKNLRIYSFADTLKSMGYTTHFMHNYEGSFFYRNQVYQNLGFDTFTSLEYMKDYHVNPKDWPEDSMLIDPVIKALSSTEGPDFIDAITVETHGRYPKEPVSFGENEITVTGPFTEKEINELAYYGNALSQTDAFIGQLVEAINQIDEKTVIVFYGDHLPCLTVFNNPITDSISHFETSMVVYSNFPLPKSSFLGEAFQLSTKISQILNLPLGPIESFHATNANSSSYETDHHLIQYNLLFGDQSYLGTKAALTRGTLQMGLEPIKIRGVQSLEDGTLKIMGNNFTRFSVGVVDGKERETEYLNEYTLKVKGSSSWDEVVVKQVSGRGVDLSQTLPYKK